MEYQSSVEYPSVLESIPQLLIWFDQFNRPPVSHPIWVEGQTALLEGFTNAVRHAHQSLPASTPVKICVELSPQLFLIQIFDQGAAFDLEAAWQELCQTVNHPDFSPLEREAHWGMWMLLKLKNDYGWSIIYHPANGCNCLLMQRTLG
jgi:serine/threonine-protein kinase RsbW